MRSSVRQQAAPQPRDRRARKRSGKDSASTTRPASYGAPGKDPTDIGKGLDPEPPYLPDVVARWSSGELFWIAKAGIRMTGMPAFGSTHKDEEIWKVVAFVQRLPTVTEADYAKMEHP